MANQEPSVCLVCEGNRFITEQRGMIFKKAFYTCRDCEAVFKEESKGHFKVVSIPEEYSNIKPYYLDQILDDSEMVRKPSFSDSELASLAKGEQPLLDETRSNMRKLIDFEIPIFLKKGEELEMALPRVSLFEERSARVSSGTRAGFRVMKGVYVSQNVTNPEYEQVIKKIDSGSFVVTNKRYVFTGEKRNVDQSLGKITSVMILNDALSVARSNKQKTEYFSGPYYFPLIGALLKGIVTESHQK